MSVIFYGEPGGDSFGRGVWLNVLQVLAYRREAVYAGADYLYTRHTLAVRAVFNPGTQQESLAGKPFTYLQAPPHSLPPLPGRSFQGPLFSRQIPPHAGTPDYNSPAVYTAEAVKHHLLQPRLRLQWAIDNQHVLISPLPGLVVDETHGPKPLSCDVAEVRGGKTFLVDWVIQTDLNECPNFTSRPHPVLSHQFSQTDILDQDFFVTRVTRGTVVFSAAVLRTANLLPGSVGPLEADSYRHLFVLPVPANMKRESVQVALQPDGVTLHYEVRDKETPLNWDPQGYGITRIEATHQVVTELPDFNLNLFGANLSAARTTGSFFDFGGWLWHNAGILGRLAIPGLQGQRNLTSLMPTTAHTINVRAWGHRGVQRYALESFVRDVTRERIAPLLVSVAPLLQRSALVHDLAGNFVEGTSVYLTGPLLPAGGVLPSLTLNRRPVFGENNDTGLLITQGPLKGNEEPLYPVPPPPGDLVARGTFLETLVSSALSEPCDPSPNVPPPLPLPQPAPIELNPDPPGWPRPAGV